MMTYVVKRTLWAVPTLLVVVTFVFIIFRLVPGDPAQLVAGELASQATIQELRHEMGLDRPIGVQYLDYLDQLAHGDLGISVVYHQGAGQAVLQRLPATLELSVAAIVLTVAIGLPAGIVSAVRRGSLVDYAATLVAVVGITIPAFWLGLILILAFAVHRQWFPVAGMGGWRHLVLPAVTLAAYQLALVARLMRSSLLEVVHQDHVRTARAKGLGEAATLLRHAVRNALVPVVTVLGYQFGLMMGGAVVIESVFAWPGVGLLLIDSVRMRDYPMVQGITVVFAVVFVLVNLIVDVAYAYLDPRIRYS